MACPLPPTERNIANLIKENGYRNQVRGYYQGYVDSKDATKTIRELLYNHEIALFNAVLELIHI